MASVSKVIHTDNQLQAGQFGKTAYTGWIPSNGVTGRINTVSVSQRHKSHLEGDTHDTSSLGVEPKAVTLVKEAFENSHGC
jgi:hypothetical protein